MELEDGTVETLDDEAKMVMIWRQTEVTAAAQTPAAGV